MYNNPVRGENSHLCSHASGKVLTALAVVALFAVGCFVLMNGSDESDATTTITVDGVRYSIDATATVIGYTDSPTSLVIPPSVSYEGTDYAVTSIWESAFSGCTTLTSVTISNSLTTIGAGAFDGCTSLMTISIPDSVTSIQMYADTAIFNGCTALTAINVDGANTKYCSENGILFNKAKTTLYQYPSGKTDTSYTIPDSVTYIVDKAFCNCSSLLSVTIPDSVSSIGDHAFMGCYSLVSLILGNSVTSIGDWTFLRCKSLTSVTLPTSINSIGSGAFRECSSITSVSIPNSVTSIGGTAFYGCTSLISVSIPNSVTSIGSNAFEGCAALTTINVDGANTAYSSENGILFDKTKATLIKYPVKKTDASYTIPDSVTSIESSAFLGCTYLTSVTIPDSVTSIGFTAFYGTSITSVTIPKSVTYVGSYAFNHCESLAAINVDGANTKYCSENGVLFNKTKTTLMQYPAKKTDVSYTIPDSVTTINDQAFSGCPLTTVTIPSSVTSSLVRAFLHCPSLEVINVDGANTVYSSEDGILFNKAKTALIQYPAAKTDTSYTIPDSVTLIEYSAFAECNNLTSIFIPQATTTIKNYAFEDCVALTTINVDGSNTAYSSENGILFDKAKTALIQYPSGKTDASYTIPESVTSIPEGAFRYTHSLKEVIFSAGNTVNVEMYAFVGCNSLETFRIAEGSTVSFDTSSIAFSDISEHTLYVIAPEGYSIPGDALAGNVKVVYGEKPDNPNNPDNNGFSITYVAIGIVVLFALFCGFILIKKRHS